MSKHTSGPWHCGLGYDNHYKSSAVGGPSKFLSEPICIIPHDDIAVPGVEEMKANARLIVAAPDLLEACKMASVDDEINLSELTWACINSAIAKAEGNDRPPS